VSEAVSEGPASPRTEVKRLPARGRYDRETIDAILDEAFVCHVGFVIDGRPRVIPTTYARAGDTLYVHGSPASAMLRSLKRGVDCCVTVTLIDGLVLARSAFHHSVNYRCVVVYGTATEVRDPEQKMEAMRLLVEHIVPGRWDDTRWPTAKELTATTVLALDLNEASAKVRTGHPVDDDEDYALPHWAGILPLVTTAGEPERVTTGSPAGEPVVPDYVRRYRRP
jgi:nitroimidazol reductase NimA-like FMN-containing flavoprotein (pyridoxamine 5'-phosphate oxidase superfamily)